MPVPSSALMNLFPTDVSIPLTRNLLWDTRLWDTAATASLTELVKRGISSFGTEKLVTLTGRDVYEIIWSADVNMKLELKTPIVLELKHVALETTEASSSN